MKTEAQRKKEAKERAARALRKTKERLGLGEPGPPSPLVTSGKQREAKPRPTSDRIPGPAPAADLLYAHNWKRGAEEREATTREMRRKATQIAPAYNKGQIHDRMPAILEPRSYDRWLSLEPDPHDLLITYPELPAIIEDRCAEEFSVEEVRPESQPTPPGALKGDDIVLEYHEDGYPN
jgi:hypothetical protein